MLTTEMETLLRSMLVSKETRDAAWLIIDKLPFDEGMLFKDDVIHYAEKEFYPTTELMSLYLRFMEDKALGLFRRWACNQKEHIVNNAFDAMIKNDAVEMAVIIASDVTSTSNRNLKLVIDEIASVVRDREIAPNES